MPSSRFEQAREALVKHRPGRREAANRGGRDASSDVNRPISSHSLYAECRFRAAIAGFRPTSQPAQNFFAELPQGLLGFAGFVAKNSQKAELGR